MTVYLAYTGMDNVFLTEEPQFTHFKTVYVRDTQSITRDVEQSFDNVKYNTGDTFISTIKQNGDFLTGVCLKLVLP